MGSLPTGTLLRGAPPSALSKRMRDLLVESLPAWTPLMGTILMMGMMRMMRTNLIMRLMTAVLRTVLRTTLPTMTVLMMTTPREALPFSTVIEDYPATPAQQKEHQTTRGSLAVPRLLLYIGFGHDDITTLLAFEVLSLGSSGALVFLRAASKDSEKIQLV